MLWAASLFWHKHSCTYAHNGIVWSLRPYLTGLETSWRLVGDSPRRLLETSRVSGESRKNQTCSIFFCWDFFQSPAGRGDISATSPLVAETNFTRDWGDVPATSPQPLRDLLETEETLRRLLRDTAWRCLTHFSDHVTERVLASSNDRSSCRSRYIDREQSRRRLRFGESASYFWSPESHESPRLISRGSRGDVSASEIGPLVYTFTKSPSSF